MGATATTNRNDHSLAECQVLVHHEPLRCPIGFPGRYQPFGGLPVTMLFVPARLTGFEISTSTKGVNHELH